MHNCVLRALSLATFVLVAGCGPGVFSAPPPPAELHVAAAANLSNIFDKLAENVQKKLGVRLISSFGSTAQLTKQIEGGAPFDFFLAADTEHPTQLVSEGLADTAREYARGRVVIWAPKHPDVQSLEDLLKPEIKIVAIANPDLAPYGRAAVQALEALKLYDKVKPKQVLAQNINAALTYAETGNADVALTAYSLVSNREPHAHLVPENLHKPIAQSLCVLKRTSLLKAAQATADYLTGPDGAAFFKANGYEAAK